MATKKTKGDDMDGLLGDEAATALVPVEQRQILVIEGEEVLAARVDRDVYVPLRPLCDALGIKSYGQVARIKRDDVMAEGLRALRITTVGGTQVMQCLHLESVPLWLAGLEPSRVREDVRDRLRVYKRWVRQRVWEAFAAETGVGQGMASTTGPVATTLDPNTLSLEQVEQFGLALVTLARQQLAFQEQHAHEMIEVRGSLAFQEQRLDMHDERLTTQDERLNRAAEVVGATVREVKALKARLDPGNVITDEQAAELQNLVKTVAHELTRQSITGGQAQTNYYASLFGELHRRFRVSSYKNLRIEQYEAALAWLQEYSHTLEQEGAINSSSK